MSHLNIPSHSMAGKEYLILFQIMRESSRLGVEASIESLDRRIKEILESESVDRESLALSYAFKAKLYEENQQLEEALQINLKLSKSGNGNGSVAFNTANILSKLNRTEEAVSVIDNFLESEKGSGQENLSLLSLAIKLLGDQTSKAERYKNYFRHVLESFGLDSRFDDLATSIAKLDRDVRTEARLYSKALQEPEEKKITALEDFISLAKLPYFKRIASEALSERRSGV